MQQMTELPAKGKPGSKGRRVGRPTYKTPETVEHLLAAIRDGLTLKQSCAACSINYETFRTWCDQDHELDARVHAAREEARHKALKVLKGAALDNGDVNAAVMWLKYSFWKDYRPNPNTNVNVHTATVVCDEETRQRLVAMRERLLGQPIHAEVIEDAAIALPASQETQENTNNETDETD